MAKHTRPFPRSVTLLFSILIGIVTFSIGFFIGESRGVRSVVPEGEGRLIEQAEPPAYLTQDIDFQQFWDVWNLTKEEFYNQPVSDIDLFYGSLKGLLSGLDDPYSIYLDPEEAEEFAANLEGSFEGIGAEIGIKDERLLIIAPLDGTPAHQAGLLPGDWIVLIDGVETIGMSVEEAVTRIRGEKGTEVVLTISRDGVDGLIEISITRDTIEVDSVKWTIDDTIMTISVSTFNHDTSDLFAQAIQEALTSDVHGIILDLRSNPGGFLSTAIDMASAWVGYDVVVIERTQEDARTYKGVKAPRLQGIPTVVLVNGGSASASEIVSGALQDYGYATVVGTQTFGKGSVQEYREWPDGSAMKITTAVWYTPKGRSINETGIAPDIEVVYTLEEYQAGIDPQYDVALEILLGTYAPEKTTTAEGDGEGS